jgi:hypothetical protein
MAPMLAVSGHLCRTGGDKINPFAGASDYISPMSQSSPVSPPEKKTLQPAPLNMSTPIAPSLESRPDYGIDAPGIRRGMLIAGGVGLTVAVLGNLVEPPEPQRSLILAYRHVAPQTRPNKLHPTLAAAASANKIDVSSRFASGAVANRDGGSLARVWQCTAQSPLIDIHRVSRESKGTFFQG